MKRTFLSVILGMSLLPAQAFAIFIPNAPVIHTTREETVQYMQQNPLLAFPAEMTITRADFVSAIVSQLYPQGSTACFTRLSPSEYSLLFSDVSIYSPHALDLCTAMRAGIVRGYTDGSFRPDAPINAAEAAKVIAKAYRLSIDPSDRWTPWYLPAVNALRSLGASINDKNLAKPLTAKEATDLLAVVKAG